MIEPRHIVIVGGGVAGLVAAVDCLRVGIRVTVLEASEMFGGSVSPVEVAGMVLDGGAESYATRGGHVRELVTALGLEDQIVTPNPAGAWLRRSDGASVPMPKTALLGIPANPLAEDVRRVIGTRGATRAYLDRVRPVLTIGREHNLAELVRKRMGESVLTELVTPVVRGVYSVGPEDIDVDRVAPGLNQALTRTGSLGAAVAELTDAAGSARAGARVEGIDGGMHVLVSALVAEITRLGGAVHADTPVTALYSGAIAPEDLPMAEDADPAAVAEPAGDHTLWSLHTAGNVLHYADRVIIATAELPAFALLADAVPALAEETAEVSPEVVLATLLLDAPNLDGHPRGSGVLIADQTDERGVRAKALTHSSAKWGWLANALAEFPGRHAVRLSFDPDRLGERTDDELAEIARADAAAILGVDLPESAVVGFARTRWRSTPPGAARGARERAERIRAAITAVPGLDVTGAWLSGTGLASVVPDAHAAAKRVRHLVATEYLENDELRGGAAPAAPSAPVAGEEDPSPASASTAPSNTVDTNTKE
ncbi:FAD-dependent oxidoreductase [Mycetocola tolaasinivorans]|uniref:FAD-dependent oxidoreductase n=1 Tax=Mycetocola tolaasinivorans TaxID=76635 RepID=A0A3L7A9E5_9MICO|nr:FAD-dependent oxidoreductase [Mycetocola tolaasinivorans]RLP76797.1 FAD-dependent oxidoreductase [Mycetocola tolaasinivorans]